MANDTLDIAGHVMIRVSAGVLSFMHIDAGGG